ncbi:hypothetical protein GGQ67_002847 [Rhizobium metallidurans]|uniref:Uncharacterized protein n=1 Tax=Rhizobium metallidurans TaxID=1265931 RepID=A0A7W6CVH9_9HYPH|nr:hypothetical protein [Rhizobium metallidurans]
MLPLDAWEWHAYIDGIDRETGERPEGLDAAR